MIPASPPPNIPVPRSAKAAKASEPAEEPENPEIPQPVMKDKIRMDVNKPKFKGRSGKTSGQARPESDFDDLDHWEDLPPKVEIDELPAEDAPVEAEAEEMKPTVVPVSGVLVPELPVGPQEPGGDEQPSRGETVKAPGASASVAPAESEDEFSPVLRPDAVPISLRPKLGLNKLERVGLWSLVALLLAAVVSLVAISLSRLPTETAKAESTDFPIEGKHLVVSSAVSYWRAPVTEGASPDTVRRGTALIPVLELEVANADGAIRVLFRNEDRAVVGDAVTRSVRGSETVRIAATAGFDDPGMHAAYRTGSTKPWTLEVYEAPSESTAGRDFKKLFEMHISAARR